MESANAEHTHENQDRKLRKALSTWDLLMLSVGGIIGSGWLFAAYGASVLSGPGSIAAWVIGGRHSDIHSARLCGTGRDDT